MTWAALLALSFVNCKNVVSTEHDKVEIKKKLIRKKRKPVTKRWQYKYKVLDIIPMSNVLKNKNVRSVGIVQALHMCRGHFKTFENGLFGKPELKGTYYWAQHARGSANKGIVDKDYNVHGKQDAS
jgi:hypothetical protein